LRERHSLLHIGPRSNIFLTQSNLSFIIVTKSRPLIAVVDDEEPILRALTRLVRSFAFEVESFPSGAEFLESLSTRQPDCLLLDLHMPCVSGFEVQAWLSKSEMHLPVVIITGHDSAETRARAMKEKPVAYLRKPVNDKELLEAIELALDSHKPRQQEIQR
jgi:FixJ family two-component response regulator